MERFELSVPVTQDGGLDRPLARAGQAALLFGMEKLGRKTEFLAHSQKRAKPVGSFGILASWILFSKNVEATPELTVIVTGKVRLRKEPALLTFLLDRAVPIRWFKRGAELLPVKVTN